MSTKMVVGGSSVTASQLKDFFRQIEDGSLGCEELQAVLEHRNPWGLEDTRTKFVTVNRDRTPQQVLDATSCRQFTNVDVVATMPKGEGNEVEVVFFKLRRYVSDIDLDKEYELRGLKPADPYSLAAVNQANPTLVDEKPNGTHWQDADGKWCFAAFSRGDVERDVYVDHCGSVWNTYWWFAGFRK